MPKHIERIPETVLVDREKEGKVKIPRRAVAPYNFIELPDKVVEADPEGKILSNNRYNLSLQTGHIECTLTTASPLYIRAGLTSTELQQAGELIESPHFFYTNPETKEPVLPASSIRGMFRNLVEIASFSKISQVSDQEKFFFRAVAAFTDDPLSALYNNKLKHVKAGYLKEKNGVWFIRPAQQIEGEPFIRIEDKNISISDFIHINEASYMPQYVYGVSFSLSATSKKYADRLSRESETYEYIGVLVTSGNMLETDGGVNTTNRKYHYLINQPDDSASTWKINESTIAHYKQSLTAFQKYGQNVKDENASSPFSEETGVLKDKRCIFYCEPKTKDGEVTLFGQSPNFRIPYLLKENGEVSSAPDFIPEKFRDSETIDIAEGIFGYVRHRKQKDHQEQTRPSKVFFFDGICQEENTADLFMAGEEGKIPKILASPKPTTFQHYLVQTSYDKIKLNHYASQPGQETFIRGHKLYWHQGKSPEIWHPSPNEASETQITRIRPIKPGKSFKFRIKFKDLSSVELGTLLWILDVAKDESYRLSLGMGKPLGMGAVKIESKVFIEKCSNRYESLFDDSGGWSTGYETVLSEAQHRSHIQRFEQHIFQKLEERENTDIGIKQLRRIKMLLKMLEWKETLSEQEKSQRRYMEIERDISKEHIGFPVNLTDRTINEYSERPILPNPLNYDSSESLIKNQNLKEDDIVEAVVIKKGKKVTYELGGVEFNEKEKKKDEIPDSGIVKVRITMIKGGVIKHIKFAGRL